MRVSCLRWAGFYFQGPVVSKSPPQKKKTSVYFEGNYSVMWSFFLYASRNQETLRDML